jgi:putative tricarboxylic transport membrane protein
VLPGIGPLAGISILLPVTYGLDATKAIVMLAGIYYGSQYGGSTTSILMRIPGEASSVMTCIDGYAMAKKGRAGAALCIAAVGSFIAGTFGVSMLTRWRRRSPSSRSGSGRPNTPPCWCSA